MPSSLTVAIVLTISGMLFAAWGFAIFLEKLKDQKSMRDHRLSLRTKPPVERKWVEVCEPARKEVFGATPAGWHRYSQEAEANGEVPTAAGYNEWERTFEERRRAEWEAGRAQREEEERQWKLESARRQKAELEEKLAKVYATFNKLGGTDDVIVQTPSAAPSEVETRRHVDRT